MAKTTDKQANTDKRGKFAKGNTAGVKWKPGQSGNPAGPPAARTQLWRYFCNYMEMSDAQIIKAKKKGLSQSQQAAMKLVEDVKAGEVPKSGKFAQYVIDRDLGKPKEHVQVDTTPSLSDDECDLIRGILKKNDSHRK